MHLSKSALSLGTVGLAAALITLAVPRAAHAVAAALVQVTNTAANPAIGQATDKQAAQLVSLWAPNNPIGALSDPTFVNFYEVNSTGQTTNNYVVPGNQTLVITSVDLTPYSTGSASACIAPTATDSVSLSIGAGGTGRMFWNVTGLNTTHFTYPSGITLGPGVTPTTVTYFFSACPVAIFMQGYLTAN